MKNKHGKDLQSLLVTYFLVDSYVEKILNQLEDLDFDVLEDDNGRDIIIPALSEVSTYFFDVDLFNVENNDVIELKKNDSEEKKKAGKQKWSVTNANAPPTDIGGISKSLLTYMTLQGILIVINR